MSQAKSLRQMIELVFTQDEYDNPRLMILTQLMQSWVQSLWTQLTVSTKPMILGTLGARVYNAAPYPKTKPVCLVSRVQESGPLLCFRHHAFGLEPIAEPDTHDAANVAKILDGLTTHLTEFRATLTEAHLFTLPQVSLEWMDDPHWRPEPDEPGVPDSFLLVGLSSWVAKPKDTVKATDPELVWFEDIGQGGWETSPLAESIVEALLQPVAADAVVYETEAKDGEETDTPDPE